ncbi:MAG TPA: hypothetical protein V6D06_11515 [Trichocoleus sp.]
MLGLVAGSVAVYPFPDMQSTNGAYPVRMLIRHKVHTKLIAALDTDQGKVPLDAALLWDLTNTLLQPSTSPNLYCPYPSRDQAAQVEEQTADEIAAAYIRIKHRADHPLVQELNRLL